MDYFPSTQRLHKEGALYIPLAIGLDIICTGLAFTFLPPWAIIIVVLFSTAFVWLILNFFRDPIRKIPQEPGLVIAPCDGKVGVIKCQPGSQIL